MKPAPAHVDPATRVANRFVDCDNPDVITFAKANAGTGSARQQAVALYYAVRDGWRYNPWNAVFTPDGYRASVVLNREPRDGHCIDKAVLLAASCRAVGIPSRLHFADVRNHVGTAKLEAQLGTDLLVYHGYTELFLEGRWVAATPAFNRALCERLGVSPLEFDGVEDSVFQAYDRQAGKFMEYVKDHGVHCAVPFDAMMAAWREHYPNHTDEWPEPLSG